MAGIKLDWGQLKPGLFGFCGTVCELKLHHSSRRELRNQLSAFS